MLDRLPGYDPDVAAHPTRARALMVKAGFGPTKHLIPTALNSCASGI